MPTNIGKIFDISPQIEELINFAQYGAIVYAPTKEGELPFYIELLWEGEMLEISKRSSVVCNVMDELSRAEFMKLETLVYAISRIGEEEFKDSDPDKNKALKDKLRATLSKSSPILIDFLYEMYDSLSMQRNTQMDEKLNELKKKNLETINKISPL